MWRERLGTWQKRTRGSLPARNDDKDKAPSQSYCTVRIYFYYFSVVWSDCRACNRIQDVPWMDSPHNLHFTSLHSYFIGFTVPVFFLPPVTQSLGAGRWAPRRTSWLVPSILHVLVPWKRTDRPCVCVCSLVQYSRIIHFACRLPDHAPEAYPPHHDAGPPAKHYV